MSMDRDRENEEKHQKFFQDSRSIL